MRRAWILIRHSVRQSPTIVLATGSVLCLFQILLILVARSVLTSDAFQEMNRLVPPFVRELMGESLASLLSFTGIVCLGYFHLAVMAALVALEIALGTVPASEVEVGFADLMLSRPLARHWVISRTVFVLVISTVVLICMMMFGTWVGLRFLAPPGSVGPSHELILSLGSNLGLLVLAWGGIAMAVGSASRRRGTAGAIAGLLALVTCLLDYVARAWKPAGAVAWLSPFRYYNAVDLIMGSGLRGRNLVVLAAVLVASTATAYVVYQRKDIIH